MLILLALLQAQGQPNDSVTVDKKRLRTVTIAGGIGYAGALTGLSQLWYKNTPHQSFRFFNDNAEWKQVDKLGHFYSSFYFSYGVSKALRWSNVSSKKSDLIGALTGFMVLLPVEIMDGSSQAYGASAGDLLANAGGASFFLSQQLLWHEQRLIPKFSFHNTAYSMARPDVLGDRTISRIFKDYNGQTYWLSADLDKFISFPKWINVAVGYGAHDMFHARDSENRLAGYRPYRQYYLSLDFDLTAIQTRSKAVKTLIFIASMIKLPAPAMEFANRKLNFHALYF